MTETNAATVAQHIAGLFPTVKPPMVKAIVQEMTNGNYDADRVLTWANWRRGESSEFNLDELRREFKKDQPAGKVVPVDARTQMFRSQTKKNEEEFEADAPNRERFKQFFEACSDADLEQLKAELLATLEPDVLKLVVNKSPRTSRYLRQLIYEHAERCGKQIGAEK